jgi:hypothetical protein
MGDCGSKLDIPISVKEQRVDGSSVFKKYRKVYSRYQRDLVFIHHVNNIDTIFKTTHYLSGKYFYYKFQIF